MKHLNIRLCSDALYWTPVAQSVMYKSFLRFLDLIFSSKFCECLNDQICFLQMAGRLLFIQQIGTNGGIK